MTKKLEEVFNLLPKEEINSVKEVEVESTEMINALDTSEKIDHALATVSGLSSHDSDMDDIIQRAIQSYEDLCDLGVNVPDAHAGRIYEVAATMLKTALEAKDAKVNRKLKTIELQLKKAKLEQDTAAKSGNQGSNDDNEFDRNELLGYIKEQAGGDVSEE